MVSEIHLHLAKGRFLAFLKDKLLQDPTTLI